MNSVEKMERDYFVLVKDYYKYSGLFYLTLLPILVVSAQTNLSKKLKPIIMSLYEKRGVSSQKEDVHAAIKNLSKGVFPGAFCNLFPDTAGDKNYVSTVHSDGAGTKAGLGYLAQLCSNLSAERIWKGIAQDSFVMNLDDLLCTGATGPFYISMNIDRNQKKISGETIAHIINGCQELCDQLTALGIPCVYCGGETADVGDLVRTITVNNTFSVRIKKSHVINAASITATGTPAIVGFSSTGKATYEEFENSGMGSNGLTNARHDVLAPHYRQYTETYSPEIPRDLVYAGKFHLDDSLPGHGGFSIASALLSPTRTYAPMLKTIFDEIGRKYILGLIHCSGGGQTKIGKFGFPGVQYVKDNLFPVPPLFRFLKEARNLPWEEMYTSYNMGHRMEAVIRDKSVAEQCIAISKSFGIDAQVIGYISRYPLGTENRGVRIMTPHKELLQYDNGIFIGSTTGG